MPAVPNGEPDGPQAGTAAADRPREGRVLGGRYQLVRRIAAGGMAEVWEGLDTVLTRVVAVKMPHARLAADPTFVERFRREAKAAARLSHPGIVSTYDFGTDGDPAAGGLAFMVMDYVEGRTLRDALAGGARLSAPDTVAIGLQVADALDYAHRAGLIHRDVKPANILLGDAGGAGRRVRVADFGVARVAGIQGEPVTLAGAVVGTARYLAPEQVEGGALDARTDVYALGCVLYEALAGAPPFERPSDVATALAHAHDHPAPLRLRAPGVPTDLEALVMATLAKSPDDRPPSAATLAASLRAVTAGSNGGGAGPVVPADTTPPAGHGWATPTATPPLGTSPVPRAPSRSALPLVAVVLVVLVALVVAVLALRRVSPTASTPPPEQTTTTSAPQAAPPRIVDIHSFDPQDSPKGQENEADARLAVDQDLSTRWTTERYRGPHFAGLKDGLGLFVVLDSGRRLAQLEVVSPTTGWSATVYVAGAPAATLEGWGRPVTTRTGIQAGTTVFDLAGAQGNAVLLWITDPGTTDGADRAEIQELRIRARTQG